MEKLLKDKVLKEQQRFSDLLEKYNDLRLSPLLSKETQAELTDLQSTMMEVNSTFQKVEVIQHYWITKVIMYLTIDSENFVWVDQTLKVYFITIKYI